MGHTLSFYSEFPVIVFFIRIWSNLRLLKESHFKLISYLNEILIVWTSFWYLLFVTFSGVKIKIYTEWVQDVYTKLVFTNLNMVSFEPHSTAPHASWPSYNCHIALPFPRTTASDDFAGGLPFRCEQAVHSTNQQTCNIWQFMGDSDST